MFVFGGKLPPPPPNAAQLGLANTFSKLVLAWAAEFFWFEVFFLIFSFRFEVLHFVYFP
jgi:hypothetical protein